MSGDENTEAETPEQGSDEDTKTETPDDDTDTETPELSDEGQQQVDEMQAAYNDDRPTAVLPGTDGTITGVAVNEWIDDDGNPKFGKDEEEKKDRDSDEPKDEDKQHEDAS